MPLPGLVPGAHHPAAAQQTGGQPAQLGRLFDQVVGPGDNPRGSLQVQVRRVGQPVQPQQPHPSAVLLFEAAQGREQFGRMPCHQVAGPGAQHGFDYPGGSHRHGQQVGHRAQHLIPGSRALLGLLQNPTSQRRHFLPLLVPLLEQLDLLVQGHQLRFGSGNPLAQLPVFLVELLELRFGLLDLLPFPGVGLFQLFPLFLKRTAGLFQSPASGLQRFAAGLVLSQLLPQLVLLVLHLLKRGGVLGHLLQQLQILAAELFVAPGQLFPLLFQGV